MLQEAELTLGGALSRALAPRLVRVLQLRILLAITWEHQPVSQARMDLDWEIELSGRIMSAYAG